MLNPPVIIGEFSPLSPYLAIGSSASKYATELAAELGSSEEIVSITLMSIFAAAQIGSQCVISKNYRIFLSLFFVIGAPPSAGKSPIVGRFLPLLERLIRTHILLSPEEERRRIARRIIIEKSIKKISKKSSNSRSITERDKSSKEISELMKEEEECVIPCSPILGSMSIQSFVKEMSCRGGYGICIDAEGGILSELNTVPLSKLSPILRSWSNESVEDITKKKQYWVEKTFILMLAMWQVDPLLQVLLNKGFQAIGLIARLLPYLEQNIQPRTGIGSVSEESECWLAEHLESVFVRTENCKSLTGEAPIFHLSVDAQNVLMRFKECVTRMQGFKMEFEAHQDIAGKLDVQAVRLAMTLHSMDSMNVDNLAIDGNTMTRACRLAIFFAYQAISILHRGPWEERLKEALPLIKSIAEWQSHALQRKFEAENFRRVLGFSKTKCDRLLFWMEDNKWLSCKKTKKRLLSGGSELVEEWVPIVNFQNLC